MTHNVQCNDRKLKLNLLINFISFTFILLLSCSFQKLKIYNMQFAH